MQEYRGCKKDLQYPLFSHIPGYGPLYRCPLALITENIFQVLDLYRICRVRGDFGMQSSGVLPCAGGIMDQPAALMDAFDILDRVRNECIIEWIEAHKDGR